MIFTERQLVCAMIRRAAALPLYAIGAGALWFAHRLDRP